MTLRRKPWWALAAITALAAFGCSHKGGLTPDQQLGKGIYDDQCAMCHEATNLNLVKAPPNLHGLFTRPTLPSGDPATDEAVRNVILHGKGIMPPFEQALSGDRLNALVQYLHAM